MVRMGVQAWKIMVCAHREKNDEQNPQNPSNTTSEIGVTAAQLEKVWILIIGLSLCFNY